MALATFLIFNRGVKAKVTQSIAEKNVVFIFNNVENLCESLRETH